MEYSSIKVKDASSVHRFTTSIIVLMFMSLNQANVIFGVNLSIADLLCVLVLVLLLFNNKLLFPLIPTMFFIYLSVLVLFTTVFIVPSKFLFMPEPLKILIDYIKLIVVFIYFNIGYSICNMGQIKKTLKWYSLFALFIGLIGIIFTIFNIKLFSNTLYIGSRFRGLISDPNYFSLIQVSAIVYFSRTKDIKALNRLLILLVLFISILVAASKTGLIVVLCYIILRTLEYLFVTRKKTSIFIFQVIAIALLITIISILPEIINIILDYLSSFIPSFARVRYLFTDFNSAVSASGSTRDNTWKSALEVIKASPIFGVGIGTYSGISRELTGRGALAHNTYLQLFSEWGILSATMFFTYIFSKVIKSTCYRKFRSEIDLVLRDIIIVFLIGSLTISLNNARMFWVFLGALVFNTSIRIKSIQ